MRITKRAVDALEPPKPNSAGYALHFDESMPGFGLKVTRAGIKTFVLDKRINGRSRRITLGRYGPLTVEQARLEAQKMLGKIATGIDPIAEKREREARGVTLRQVFDEYLKTRKALKENTRRDYEQVVKEAFSNWMDRPLAHITKDAIERRHAKRGEVSPARANYAMRVLRALFNFAAARYEDGKGRSLFPENPVRRLSHTRAWYRVDRRRTVIKPHQIKDWMQAVLRLADTPDRAPGEGKHKPRLKQGAIARDYFLLVLLTGLRRTEALALRWEDVDLKARTLTVHDPKNRQPHTLPLPDYLMSLLKRRKAESGDKYVFSSPDGARFSNMRFTMERVIEDSGVKFCIHDLRRTFATVADSLDIPGYAVKALLNHKMNGDVTAGYIVTDVERLREPMQKVTDYILKCAGLKESAGVVPLRGKKVS